MIYHFNIRVFVTSVKFTAREQTEIEKRGQDVIKDDYNELTYIYWGYHLINFGACCFLMMTTTNWISPDTLTTINENQYTFWIKAITTALIIFVFTGSLLAPVFCNQQYQKVHDVAEEIFDAGHHRSTGNVFFSKKMHRICGHVERIVSLNLLT